MNKPQAILFDFVDTLVTNLRFDPLAGNARLLEYAVDQRGVDPEDVMAEVDRIKSQLPSEDFPMIEFTSRQFNRLLFDRLGIAFRGTMADLELEFWKSSVLFDPEPGASDALTALSGRNIRMGVISNHPCTAAALSWELQRHDLLGHFEFVISSADYGIRKPHSLIFTSAAHRLGIFPSEVWYMGDTLQTDVLGAKQCQMTAIWYNRSLKESEDVTPDAEVRSWDELLVLVERHLEGKTNVV